ncbi:MAG: YveK family protein [Anaeromassilibacillus sp.]
MQEKKEGERMQNRMDLRSLLRLIGRSSPIWLLCMLLCAAGVYGVSAYCIPPSYTASATLYIYNSQEDTRELNAGNVDTSRKLVSTCSVVLQSDRTLEQVLRRTGGKRSLEELRGMLHMEAVDHTKFCAFRCRPATRRRRPPSAIRCWTVRRRNFCASCKGVV